MSKLYNQCKLNVVRVLLYKLKLMPSPASLAIVFDMATAVPTQKFITMNLVVTRHYGRLLNTSLYFHQPEGKISIRLIQEAMGIEFFRVKLVVILHKYAAVVDYYPSETRIIDHHLRMFSGDYPIQSGVVPVECYRIDDKVAFFHLQDLAFVYGIGISLMGLIPTDKIHRNPLFQPDPRYL